MINETIDKYLEEKVSRREAMKKLIKVIDSIDSEKQVKTAVNMITNYVKTYGPAFFSGAVDYNLVLNNTRNRGIKELKTSLEKKQKEGKLPKNIDIDDIVKTNS